MNLTPSDGPHPPQLEHHEDVRQALQIRHACRTLGFNVAALPGSGYGWLQGPQGDFWWFLVIFWWFYGIWSNYNISGSFRSNFAISNGNMVTSRKSRKFADVVRLGWKQALWQALFFAHRWHRLAKVKSETKMSCCGLLNGASSPVSSCEAVKSQKTAG